MKAFFLAFKGVVKVAGGIAVVSYGSYPFVFTNTTFYYKPTDFNSTLLERCSRYLTNYRPLPVFSAGLRQIVFNKWLCEDRNLKITYKRHLLTLKDGGTIALDWAMPEENEAILWNPIEKERKR